MLVASRHAMAYLKHPSVLPELTHLQSHTLEHTSSVCIWLQKKCIPVPSSTPSFCSL
uniref:Uncharacterized protein n=1 Tax=Arundo donax TaxID=35708 RepID=A0A0A8YXZ2_ARUDO